MGGVLIVARTHSSGIRLRGYGRISQRLDRNDRPALKNPVKRGENEQRQQCRADQAANHNRGEWLLNFAAGSGGEEHRNQAERGHSSGNGRADRAVRGGGHAGGQLGWSHFGLGDASEAEVRNAKTSTSTETINTQLIHGT